MVGRRYLIQEQLGRGGMGVVYTALDSFTGKQVALKKSGVFASGMETLAPTADNTEFRLLLVNEFKILAGLRHPNIISVLDYGFDEDKSPYFTMELLQNARSLRDAGQDRPMDYKLDLVVQMLQALAYLHRHNILHRDLKPGNVLVVNGEVKVLDFGIAMLRKQAAEDDQETVGTPMYMAPEILRGMQPTPAADLYAVGVMAYELFVGQHPFHFSSMNDLYNDILFSMPEVPVDTLGAGLALVIQRLLLKSPEDRYASANAVIEALNEATDHHFEAETAATRSSFLEAAPFAGREREMQQLLDEMSAALKGEGRSWLIGGENGVGKSRLTDELRIHALVEGANVLRGQAISEQGNPYEVWPDVLYRLSVLSDIDPQEAAILAPIVPKIATLVSGELPQLPEVDAGAAQDRMFRTIEGIIARYNHPLLIILSDLHWADDESLQLLARLLPMVSQKPVMLVGSYRDDERPRLPELLPGMNLLKVKRLDAQGIEAVLVSILGEVGHNRQLIALLERETEGNMFFLLEVVRALAEEAGQLDQINAMRLPEKVVTGGVQAIIDRRLDRVPAADRPLLNLAAVAGRQLDLDVLQKLEPEIDFDEWLSDASEAAVLEVEEETWSFAHNQVRERIVADLDEDTFRALHRRLAEAIEAVYPDGEGQFAALAQHWEWAQEADKAFRWYKLAGENSEEAYAPIKAIEYYRKALSLMGAGRKAARQRVEIFTGLGKMLRWQTHFDEAADIYRAMLSEAEDLDDKIAQARALIGLSDVLNSQGDRQGTFDYALQAETVAREVGKKAQRELLDALGNKAWGQYRLKQDDAAWVTAQEALELARSLKLREPIGRNLSILGSISGFANRLEESETFMREAADIARELGSKRDIAIRVNNLGELRKLRGDFHEAITLYKEALDGFREIGYRDNELAALHNLGVTYVELQEYATGESYLRQVVDIAAKDWWVLYETYLYLAQACFAQANLAEATIAAQRALEEGKKNDDKAVVGKSLAILAQISARLGMYMEIDGRATTTAECYERSTDCFAEGDPERARILELWGKFEYESDNDGKAKRLIYEAHDIYSAAGMVSDADRLKANWSGIIGWEAQK
jgi:tetratricopeptide (TPR) repeat protein/tRNA A-37 threonylcarbamoyl transferase component Bud32